MLEIIYLLKNFLDLICNHVLKLLQDEQLDEKKELISIIIEGCKL